MTAKNMLALLHIATKLERCPGRSKLGSSLIGQVTVPCMLWGFGTAVGELQLGLLG